ncbi:MAG: trypsin-like peptidase domain-containing protein [Actinomycetota bacterium]
MMRARVVAVLLAVAASVAVVPARAISTAHIQPGAPLLMNPTAFPDNTSPYTFRRCTLGFVFTDPAGALYVITAGHCLGLGAKAYDESREEFGTVVYHLESGTDDVSLIAIEDAKRAQVDPSVRTWGGPTAVAPPSAEHEGDEVLFTGFSFGLGDVAATSARNGVLVADDDVHYMADTSASEGDSGAPIIDASTGAAIGIVRDFGLNDDPPVTDDGPTVARIRSLFAAAGFQLSLATAAYQPPPV